MDNSGLNYGSYNFLVSDPELREHAEYKRVQTVISSVIRSGAVQLGAGSCIGMSNIVQSALKHAGIESRLVECQVTLTYNYDSAQPQLHVVGFEKISNPGELDTHVVVVTDTEPPFIIDASISHRLPAGTHVIFDKVTMSGVDADFCSLTYPSAKLKISYAEKPAQTIPLVYQNNFIDRMATDRKIFNEMRMLRTLNYIGIGVSIFALLNVLLKVFRIF